MIEGACIPHARNIFYLEYGYFPVCFRLASMYRDYYCARGHDALAWRWHAGIRRFFRGGLVWGSLACGSFSGGGGGGVLARSCLQFFEILFPSWYLFGFGFGIDNSRGAFFFFFHLLVGFFCFFDSSTAVDDEALSESEPESELESEFVVIDDPLDLMLESCLGVFCFVAADFRAVGFPAVAWASAVLVKLANAWPDFFRFAADWTPKAFKTSVTYVPCLFFTDQ